MTMKPISFPEKNKVWAENQPQYQPLPTYSDGTQTISCWAFTWKERLQVLFGRPLWLLQLNFGQPLQPQLLTMKKPIDP